MMGPVVDEVELDRPPAGTACARCKRKAHFCPAVTYDGDEAVCLHCEDGVECPTSAAIRRLSADYDGRGDFVADVAPGEVRHIEPPRAASVAAREAAEEVKSRVGQVEEPAVEKKNEQLSTKKICRHPECEVPTYSKIGVCSKHYYWATKGAGAAKTAEGTKDPGPGREAQEMFRARENQRNIPAWLEQPLIAVELRLTEAQCDALFQKCTPEQKAVALAAALHSALVTTN